MFSRLAPDVLCTTEQYKTTRQVHCSEWFVLFVHLEEHEVVIRVGVMSTAPDSYPLDTDKYSTAECNQNKVSTKAISK